MVFQDNNVTIGTTGTVSGGVAPRRSPVASRRGTHPLTAIYSGNPSYATSTGSLSLTVTAPVAPDFSIGLSNIQLIASGATPHATTNVNITAVGGLSSAISLACSGLPAAANCVFSPQTVTPNSGDQRAVCLFPADRHHQHVSQRQASLLRQDERHGAGLPPAGSALRSPPAQGAAECTGSAGYSAGRFADADRLRQRRNTAEHRNAYGHGYRRRAVRSIRRR